MLALRGLLTILILCLSASTQAQEAAPLTRPALLKPGDTIMIVAPSGYLSPQRTKLAVQRLEEREYHVKMRDDVLAYEGYLAGSDQRRAEELMQAFRDPEVDAVFPGTGGYGVTRMLDLLDFEVIRKNPKLLIGFSDITALHIALNQKAGFVTYHSPAPLYGLGSEDNLTPFSEKYFFRAVEAGPDQGHDYAIEITRDPTLKIADDVPQPVGLGKGIARGRLVGGNLTLIAALQGTPYEIDTRDAILLIEDVDEAPYRIDRMLQQLESAGKLATLRGAVIGQFTGTEKVRSIPDQIAAGLKQSFWNVAGLVVELEPEEASPPPDARYKAEGVLRQYFEPLGIPVLMNFPIGHHKFNCTLPMGGEVEVDADQATLRVIAGGD